MKNKMIVTFKKDIRTMLRDKKSLAMMMIMPIIIPVFIFVFSYSFELMMDTETLEPYSVGVSFELTKDEQDILNQFEDIQVKYIPKDDIIEAYENKEIVAYITLEDGIYHIYHNPNDQDSYIAAISTTGFLESYSQYLGQEYLIDNGINPELVFNLVSYELEELEPQNQLVNTIILMAFIFTIMSITMTSVTSATDAIAGEKERGTLETLLTFPTSSEELVAGKYLANFIACIITAFICVLLAFGSLIIAQSMFSIYDEITISFNLSTIFLSILILIGYSLLIGGATIAVASYTKSYKEAQSALTPLTFVPMLPMFMDLMNIEVSLFIAAIPGVGQTMLLNEVFVGTISTQQVFVMLISNIIFVIILLKFIVKLYKSEKILFSL